MGIEINFVASDPARVLPPQSGQRGRQAWWGKDIWDKGILPHSVRKLKHSDWGFGDRTFQISLCLRVNGGSKVFTKGHWRESDRPSFRSLLFLFAIRPWAKPASVFSTIKWKDSTGLVEMWELHEAKHRNGTPLQYSCLENPMDRGAWWAEVHGVAKSHTRLSDFTLTFHFHALEKEMATHFSVLAWRIPGTGEPGGLPPMGLHRVGHN